MSERILVVDDSTTIQKVIRIAFSRFAASVLTATSYIEALAEVNRSKPTVILADANLSGARSLQHFKRLTEAAEDVPMLLLVGSYEGIDEAAFQSAGFKWFLKKPFEAADIVRKVGEILGRELRHEGVTDTAAAAAAAGNTAPQPLQPSTAQTTRLAPPGQPGKTHILPAKDLGKTHPTPPPPAKAELPPVPTIDAPWGADPSRSVPAARASSPEVPVEPPRGFALGRFDSEDNELPGGAVPPPDADMTRRGRKAFDEMRAAAVVQPSPVRPSEPVKSQQPSIAPAKVEAVLGPMIRDELAVMVRKAVEEYCVANFGSLAREVVLAEIRRLAEDKARHLTD